MNKKILLLTISFLFILSGCSNKDMTAKQSGFLDDYESLKPSPYEKGALMYISPGAKVASYKNVIIEPVRIIVNNEEIKTDTGLLKEMSEYLTNRARKAIEINDKFKLVDQVEENTLRVEIALTAVIVSHDDIQVYQFIPVALVLTGASRATGVVNEKARVLAEMKVTDATTNESLIRVIDLQKGKRIDIRGQEVTFELVQPVLDTWAERFSSRLKYLKEKQK